MRTRNENTRPSLPRITGRLLALGALALMACESQSTAPDVAQEPGEQVIEFELTSEGALAAQTASMVGHHKLPTVALRNRENAAFDANVAMMDNSPFDLTYYWWTGGDQRHLVHSVRELSRQGGDLLGERDAGAVRLFAGPQSQRFHEYCTRVHRG